MVVCSRSEGGAESRGERREARHDGVEREELAGCI